VRLLLATVVAALLLPVAPAAAAPPPKLPAPTYQSVSKEVLIRMDDGVRLAATVAFPSLDGQNPAPGRFPVVLGMTPYGRNGVCGCVPPDFFATRGMVGAAVDVRGAGGSEGNLDGNFFSPREQRDGYDLVEYFGTQRYSTGKVGMAGGSYVGITQYLAAEQQPPHLAAIVPVVSLSDLYRDAYTHGGVPNLFFDAQYIAVQGAPGAAGTNTDPYLLQESLGAKLGQSPLGTIAFDYLARPDDDPFYRDRSPIYRARKIKVPVLDIGQWHDGLLRGEPEMFRVLSRRRGVETRLHMDPCTHKGCGAPFAPFTNPPGVTDFTALTFEFLDKYLRGANTPRRPRVEFYLQGRNRYVSGRSWPPSKTRYQRFALGPGSLAAPGTASPPGPASQQYVTDPAAGFSMAFDQYGTVAASPYLPTDQRLEGPHGLTFRTPALSRPLRLTGPLALHLVAASTANDTDWYAKLADVAPDGSESIITEGALRASHRALDPAKSTPARPYHTHTNPQPIEPNRNYDYDVEIWPTAYELAPGHQLQLRLTSTDLPTHLPGSISVDRANPQDARVNLLPPAMNTVQFGGSYLVLPVSG
jgi:putative CocE/NonD family hydrolase